MKYIKLLYLGFGIVLLTIILHDTNIHEVWQLVARVGWSGITFVTIVYFFAFMCDVGGWQLTLKAIPLDLQWLYRLFLVRMVGEALNRVTPFASLGGEPMKAILLKNHYQIGYRESGVSLMLSRTIDLIGLVVFLGVGLVLLLTVDVLPITFKTLVGLGSIAFGTAIAIFFLLQRFQLMSRLGRYLSRFSFGKNITGLLHVIQDTDERLMQFYTRNKWRFRFCLLFSFVNWPLGVVEVYYLMHCLGHPITFKDAYVIESTIQLIRNGFFFIPSNIGTQEGAFLLTINAIVGDRSLGLALALMRRLREILWILLGLGIWGLFSLKFSKRDRFGS